VRFLERSTSTYKFVWEGTYFLKLAPLHSENNPISPPLQPTTSNLHLTSFFRAACTPQPIRHTCLVICKDHSIIVLIIVLIFLAPALARMARTKQVIGRQRERAARSVATKAPRNPRGKGKGAQAKRQSRRKTGGKSIGQPSPRDIMQRKKRKYKPGSKYIINISIIFTDSCL
jgi:hypothetical protein